MKKTRKIVQLMVICGGLWFSTDVYATEGVLPIGQNKTTEDKTAVKEIPKQVEDSAAQQSTTTQPAIQFEEDEYVRITQPLADTEDGIKTFDAEINVMGEARMDTEIEIITYTQDKGKSVEKPSDSEDYTEYKLKSVGATQTFSQMIKLYEGKENHIIIYYTYKAHDIEGSIRFVITRESEEMKNQLKNYIVTDPKVMLDQIPQ